MSDLPAIERPNIVTDVEKTIEAVKPGPALAGLVTLARMYAAAIQDADGSQHALREIGPKLATVLTKLGELARPAASPGAGSDELSAADEVAAMRRRHDDARRQRGA